MAGKTTGELEDLKAELERLELQQKISEARKKKAEADKALEPLSEIERVKQLAEDEKAIAEARKAVLKAQLPDLDVKALEGKLTVDDNVMIECQILTYKAVSEIAVQISGEVKKTGVKRVIIYNESDLNAVLSYKAFIWQVNLLKEQYDSALAGEEKEGFKFVESAAAVAGVSAGAFVLKSFLGAASLFRADADVKGKKVDVSDEALVAEVARALKSADVTTIYPVFINTVPGKLLSVLSGLSEIKESADQKIIEWSANAKFKDKVTRLKNLNAQYEKILSSLAGADEKTGSVSRLEKLMKGETLSTKLDEGDTDVLYLKVAAGGGNNKSVRNLLWTRLEHSGGAVITYFLLSKDGDIKASKTFYNTTGYKEFEDSRGKAELNNFNGQ